MDDASRPPPTRARRCDHDVGALCFRSAAASNLLSLDMLGYGVFPLDSSGRGASRLASPSRSRSRLRTHCNARGRVGARGTCHRDGASGGPRPPFREAAREEGQQDVLRLHDAEPEVDVEKLWRVRVLGLQRNPSLARRAHIPGQVREHGPMEQGGARSVPRQRREPESADVLRAARVGLERARADLTKVHLASRGVVQAVPRARDRGEEQRAVAPDVAERGEHARGAELLRRSREGVRDDRGRAARGQALDREARRAHARRRESVRPARGAGEVLGARRKSEVDGVEAEEALARREEAHRRRRRSLVRASAEVAGEVAEGAVAEIPEGRRGGVPRRAADARTVLVPGRRVRGEGGRRRGEVGRADEGASPGRGGRRGRVPVDVAKGGPAIAAEARAGEGRFRAGALRRREVDLVRVVRRWRRRRRRLAGDGW
eukprot:31265-Pelagococcus_subviridis.AAC.23